MRRIKRKLQPPFAAVLDTMAGAWLAQGVYTATKLGIADALRDGPLTTESIADRVAPTRMA